jgi:hypothetical protein
VTPLGWRARRVWKQLGIRKEGEICRAHERLLILAILLQPTSDQFVRFRIWERSVLVRTSIPRCRDEVLREALGKGGRLGSPCCPFRKTYRLVYRGKSIKCWGMCWFTGRDWNGSEIRRAQARLEIESTNNLPIVTAFIRGFLRRSASSRCWQ